MPKVPHGEFSRPQAYPLDGIILVDPDSGKPYKAGVTIQQVEGGFDPTGLATDYKQDEIVEALENLVAVIQASVHSTSEVTNETLPPVEGQATAAKQDSILSALNNLAGILGGPLTVAPSESMGVEVISVPLAEGAATSARQDAIVAALGALQTALTGSLDVLGQVSLSEGSSVAVTGSVELSNASIAVTPSGTFTVALPGSATSAKQDQILTALGNLLTAVQAPQPITDNGGSLTIDGTVGISGTVPITDNGGSLTVDGEVNAKQSGAWNVGITGTPTVALSGPVTITDGSGPVTIDGSVNVANTPIPVSQSGTWTMQTTPGASATSAALTSFRNGNLSPTPVPVKTASGRVYQYAIHNPTNVTVFAHFYDALVANVTPGTTVPKMTFAVPAGSTLDGYWSISHGFTTAISVAASTAWDGSGALPSPAFVTLGFA